MKTALAFLGLTCLSVANIIGTAVCINQKQKTRQFVIICTEDRVGFGEAAEDVDVGIILQRMYQQKQAQENVPPAPRVDPRGNNTF